MSPTEAQKNQTTWAILQDATHTPRSQAHLTLPELLWRHTAHHCPPASKSVRPNTPSGPIVNPILTSAHSRSTLESQAKGSQKQPYLFTKYTHPLLLECITGRGRSRGLTHLRPLEHQEMWNMGGALPPHQTPGWQKGKSGYHLSRVMTVCPAGSCIPAKPSGGHLFQPCRLPGSRSCTL